jgi:hypothetical protein
MNWGTKMTDPDKDDLALDALFQTARAQTIGPDDDLIARIMADAARLQPKPAALVPRPINRPGWLAALGGWPALSGLVAASATGFWLGVAPPEGLTTWATSYLGTADTVSLDPSGDYYGLSEG